MNELKYTMLCLLLTGLMCLGPASFIKSQSVQVTVEVESELSGMENDRLFLTQPFYQNIEVEAEVEGDENEAILGSYMAGCIAVRSKENIPVIIRTDILNADGSHMEISDYEIHTGFINDGGACPVEADMINEVSNTLNRSETSFRLNHQPYTIRNLPALGGEVRGFITILSPRNIPDASGMPDSRRTTDQESGTVLKIDIEYL